MELQHHGIKGMKWGIRRTDEQLARARGSSNHPDYDRAHSKKSVKKMSDQELRERNNRLNAEEQYRRNRSNSTAVSRGRKAVLRIVTGAAIGVASAAATNYMNKGKDAFVSKIIPKIGDAIVDHMAMDIKFPKG